MTGLQFQIRYFIPVCTSFNPLAESILDMAEENDESERAVVTTYVPRYQKQQWKEHAEELDMSQSEFVKTMVQAGRRGFGEEPGERDSATPSSDRPPQGSSPEDGENDDLESTVIAALEDTPHMSWDDLLEAVIGDVEADLEETITTLQEQNRITHSPRKGGYVLMEG